MALNLTLYKKNEASSENLILLIHGLGASDSTWSNGEASWIDLFLSDESFSSLDVAEITYDTSHLANGLLSSMGIKTIKVGRFRSLTVGRDSGTTIEILARELKREINSKKIKQYKNVVLIGHSMGGLIAVRYILEEFENKELHNVKGIISIATPYNGSSFAVFSQLIKSVNKHAQIPSLVPNSVFLDETIRLWQKHLESIDLDFKFFFGTEDDIVPENSAIPHIISSKWTGGIPLPGNHTSIVEVKNHSTKSYSNVSEAAKEIFEKDIMLKKKMINEKRKLTVAKSIMRLKANGLDQEQSLYVLENKRYNFEYLKPNADKRLVVIVGEFGVGKSFAIDKIYLDLLLKAENDINFPSPININAAQLDTDVQTFLENIIADDSLEYWITVDGMDEVQLSIASSILENMRIATERWSNLRVILTSRPLTIFYDIAETVFMKGLSQNEALELVNFINNQEKHYHLHNFPKEIGIVIQRPLFAILLGLYLNKKNSLIPNSSGELLSYLIESALEKVEINESHIKQLLMNLAMISTCKGNIPVKKSEVGDIIEIRNLLNTGIVIEEKGYLSFVLPILSQWFAAKSLAENLISINRIIESGNLDYWKYPLVIINTIFKEREIDDILNVIVEKDPGFAAILIEESIRKWGILTENTSLSAKECGEKIRISMSSWIKPLDVLAEIIAPIDNELNILPIGVKKDNEWLTTSWYRGANNPPKISILEINRNELDWPSFRSARPGDKSSWYWRWTLEELRDSLSKVVKNKSLPLFEGIIYTELMWRITLKIINQGSLYTESICLDEIKLKLDQEYQHINHVTLDNKYVPMSIYREYVTNLESKNILVINCPLPGRDINNPKGNWVWSSYSDEQLYFRTSKIYKEAILGYKELVEMFFPVLKQRLRKYVLYPFVLKGEFSTPEENTSYPLGPTMKWHLEPLPLEKTECIVDIRISNIKEKIIDKDLYEIAQKIKDYRPDSSAWLGASQSSQVLDIFGAMPVTEIIYNWLEQDLKSIDWIK